MTVRLFGWDNQTYDFEIGELDEIESANMKVFDGREFLTVHYKNGKVKTFREDTVAGHLDGRYPVYNSATGFNLFAGKKWLSATSAYKRMI